MTNRRVTPEVKQQIHTILFRAGYRGDNLKKMESASHVVLVRDASVTPQLAVTKVVAQRRAVTQRLILGASEKILGLSRQHKKKETPPKVRSLKTRRP